MGKTRAPLHSSLIPSAIALSLRATTNSRNTPLLRMRRLIPRIFLKLPPDRIQPLVPIRPTHLPRHACEFLLCVGPHFLQLPVLPLRFFLIIPFQVGLDE